MFLKPKKIGNRPLLLMLGLTILAFTVFWGTAFPLTDTDLFWHLSAGKWILQHQKIPLTDPFCLSSQGIPWVNAHWGYQVIFYGLWKILGLSGLVSLKALIILLVFAIPVLFAKYVRMAWWQWILISLFATQAAFASRYFLDFRPLIFTLLILQAQAFLLLRGLHAGDLKYVTSNTNILDAHSIKANHNLRAFKTMAWGVPLLQVVLVQLQGLHPLGLIQTLCLLTGYQWRQKKNTSRQGPMAFIFAMVVAQFLATFLQPYGWRAAMLPWQLLLRILPISTNPFSLGIAENLPLHLAWNDRPELIVQFFLSITIPVLFFWLRWKRERILISMGVLLLVFFFAILSWMAIRNLPLLHAASTWAMTLSLIYPLQKPVSFPFQKWSKRAICFISAFAVFTWNADTLKAKKFELPHSSLSPFRFPTGATQFLQKYPMAPIFNDMREGGYLGFAGLQPFVDGRMILHTPEFFNEFQEVFARPNSFLTYQERYGFQAAILSIAETNRALPLIAFMIESMHWNLVFCDGATVVLFANATTQPSDAPNLSLDYFSPQHPIQQAIQKRFSKNRKLHALALSSFAGLCVQIGKENSLITGLDGKDRTANETLNQTPRPLSLW